MQQVIWTDEKIFVLNQRPNRKNDGTWSSENPRKVLEVSNRNGKMMMIFVAIVDGHIPIVHAFMGEDGKSQSVNGDHYQQTVCRRKWWSFPTPCLIGSKTCHVIFIKVCYE